MGVDFHHIIDRDIQPNCPKYTFHIQIHHLRERFIRMCVKLLPPRSSRVREQNIHMVRGFAHFRYQLLDIGDFGAVCSNRDSDGAGAFG